MNETYLLSFEDKCWQHVLLDKNYYYNNSTSKKETYIKLLVTSYIDKHV